MSMVRINQKSLSMGRIWSTNSQGKRFLTKEGESFKDMIGLMARTQLREMKQFKGKVHFEAKFYGNWYTKKGEIHKTVGDLDNWNKLLLDGISEGLEFNDAQVFKISTEKIDDIGFWFEFRVSEYKKGV